MHDRSNACYADIGIRAIMPNHELCRADLTHPKRRAWIDEPTRHNQGDFSKGDQRFISDKERAMAVR